GSDVRYISPKLRLWPAEATSAASVCGPIASVVSGSLRACAWACPCNATLASPAARHRIQKKNAGRESPACWFRLFIDVVATSRTILGSRYVKSLYALWALGNFKCYFLALFQGFEAIHLDG